MKYFMPDWDDRLDTGYDFQADSFSAAHLQHRRKADKFVHEFVRPFPYDGLLISLATFGKKTPRKKDREHPWELDGAKDIREYFRLPKGMEIMGDCGAFSYVSQKSPPPDYSPKNVARAYAELGVDYGFSVDHLAVPFVKRKRKGGGFELRALSKKERQDRVDLSVTNARKFLREWERKEYPFTPIGVVQGIDPASYADSAQRLVKYGYDYLALGGLVQHPTAEILKIVHAVRAVAPDVRLHLLGVLRPKALDDLRAANVTSFDSASFLRKAWLRSGQNYLGVDGEWYAAIRVPQLDHHEEELKDSSHSLDTLRSMEQAALASLRGYERGDVKLETCLSRLMKYDELLLRESEADVSSLKAAYRRTLKAAPWKECPCDICKAIGIEVVIFRGLNRNKRRGFHNSWVFRHKILQGRLPPASKRSEKRAGPPLAARVPN